MPYGTPDSWLGIELRHLAALHAVATERSFVRAAEELGYTQSAISNQIAALERLVSARLVERARGGGAVSLTPTGELLHEHAVALMARLQAARADVRTARSDSAPALRVGYFQSVGASVLPAIVRTFTERFPEVVLDLDLGHAERLQQETVAAGELELAFVATPLRVASLESRHLFDDPFVLLGPDGGGADSLDLSRRPLLAYNPCAVQRVLEEQLERDGMLASARVQRLEDGLTILALVAAGCAYALLPRLAVDTSEHVLRTFDAPRRDIHIVWHRDRALSTAAEQFVEVAAEAFAAHAPAAAAA